MKYVFNVFTGTFDLIDTSSSGTSTPNKIIYTNEDVTVATNTFLVLIEPQFVGTSTLSVLGTGILEIH